MGRHLAETTRLLGWRYANIVFSLLALLSAASALMLPGPADQLTGFSSVLIVGALALLAGHAWGVLVIGVAQVLILGKAWPIVSDIITTSGFHGLANWAAIAAIATTATALPGILLFATTRAFTVEVIVGHKNSALQRPGELLASFAAVMWLARPLIG